MNESSVMPGDPILEVYSVGPTTVVGFGGRDLLDTVNLAACRDEVVQLLTREKCRVLAFDLTGVKLIPSGLLGLLASIRQLGAEVHLYNPSDDVRDVLEVTSLNKLMPVHEVDLGDRA
jgi:anti-anti-sigma factor